MEKVYKRWDQMRYWVGWWGISPKIVQYMVAMVVVMQHAIYRALDCFDLPTHCGATSTSIMQFILNTSYTL